jgi:hypothetical protein
MVGSIWPADCGRKCVETSRICRVRGGRCVTVRTSAKGGPEAPGSAGTGLPSRRPPVIRPVGGIAVARELVAQRHQALLAPQHVWARHEIVPECDVPSRLRRRSPIVTAARVATRRILALDRRRDREFRSPLPAPRAPWWGTRWRPSLANDEVRAGAGGLGRLTPSVAVRRIGAPGGARTVRSWHPSTPSVVTPQLHTAAPAIPRTRYLPSVDI